MAKITQADTHALLEKFIEYVTTEVPTKKEINARLDKIEQELHQKADKSEVNEIKKDVKDNKQKINIILNGQDKQAKQLDDIKTELAATNSALLRHEQKITALEQK